MATTIVTKSGSGAPAASDLVAGELAVDLTNKRLYTEDSGGTVLELGTNPSGNVTFGDNGKAIFGAGSDLQIYSDGHHSIIKEGGAGSLLIRGDHTYFTNSAGTEGYADFIADGAVILRHNNLERLSTTATGIDVTGSVTADGLTVEQNVGSKLTFSSTDAAIATSEVIGEIDFYSADASGIGAASRANISAVAADGAGAGDVYIKTSTGGAVVANRLKVANNGDISFYNTAGTSQSFFWDASAESLGIGTSSPTSVLDVRGESLFGSGTDGVKLTYSGGNNTGIIDTGFTSTGLEFRTGNSEAMRIDSSGNTTFKANNTAVGPIVTLENTATAVNGQAWGSIHFDSNDTSTSASGTRASIVGTSTSFNGDGNLVFSTAPSNGTNTERFRIASDGSLSTPTAGAFNVRFGSGAGISLASGGNYNTLIGDNAGSNISAADGNTFIGYAVGYDNTTGNNNVAIGSYDAVAGAPAFRQNETGSKNVAVGNGALAASIAADFNTAVGHQAGLLATTGTQNTFVGAFAGDGTDDGSYNVAVGVGALSANCGNSNTVVGTSAAGTCTGAANTVMGVNAGYSLTSGDNNLLLGKDAGRAGSPGGAISTASNIIVLGDENITNAHIQVAFLAASDARDKTDFTPLDLGLEFVKALAPVTYKWDKRSKYGDKTAEDYDLNDQTPDGTHKEDWLDIGFKAQEVEALEIAAGYDKDNKTNLVSSYTGDGKQMGLKYDRFVPILVKAIQEQQTLIESLTARIAALEE